VKTATGRKVRTIKDVASTILGKEEVARRLWAIWDE
jgi:hypothetical protein